MTEKSSYAGFWRSYFVGALQNLLNFHGKGMPAGFDVEGSGPGRVLVVSWESVIAGLVPPEGSLESVHPTLLALQIVAASPSFARVCPLLRDKLVCFLPLLQPAYPSVLTSHLVETDGRVTLGDLDRFARLRLQLSRLLKARPRVRATIRVEFESFLNHCVVPDADAARRSQSLISLPLLVDADGPSASALVALASTVCTSPTPVRTSAGAEAGAILRRERYGVLVDGNYIIVRHAGVANDVLTNGDLPHWLRARTVAEQDPEFKLTSASNDLRDWLRETFKMCGHDAAARAFKKHPNLSSYSYNADTFSVLYRASVTEFIGKESKRTGESASRSEIPTRRRRIRELAVPPPEDFKTQIIGDNVLMCRKNGSVFVNVDCVNNIDIRRLIGIPRRDFVAYDEAGQPCYRFKVAPAMLYISLTVLSAQLRHPGLATRLFELYGKEDDWRRAFDAALLERKQSKRKAPPFNFEEDAYLIVHARRWKRSDFWSEFVERFPHHTEDRLRRRAAYVRYMARTYNVSAEQLHNIEWLDANVKGKTLKRFRYIYKCIKEVS